MFYWSVIQAVLLFGADSWALLDKMMSKVESNHVVFLYHITGKWVIRESDWSWETPVAKEVLQAVGVQLLAMYTVHRQAKVA